MVDVAVAPTVGPHVGLDLCHMIVDTYGLVYFFRNDELLAAPIVVYVNVPSLYALSHVFRIFNPEHFKFTFESGIL